MASYRQCKLIKKTVDGQIETTGYIPSKYKKGDIVKLLKDGKWVDGWEIVHAGEITDEPLDSHIAIKQHRKKHWRQFTKEVKNGFI